MKGRERFLTALSNKKPDRLPCQVHSFMPYFLVKNMLLGNLRAYKYFGMDPVLYLSPQYLYRADSKELAHSQTL